MEIVWIAGLVGLLTLARIVAALLRSGLSGVAPDPAWLVLFLAFVAIWKEIAALQAADPPG